MYDYDEWDEIDNKARDEIWTVEEVAERWKVSPANVRSLMLQGKLKGFKVGKLWRLYLSDIMEYESREVKSGKKVVNITTMPQPKVVRII